MEKNILVVNIGSSSKKYSLYSGENLLLAGHFERDKSSFALTYTDMEPIEITEENFSGSLSVFYDKVKSLNYIHDARPITKVGLRVVAPGIYFTEDRLVDATFLEKFKEVAKKDLAHIKPVLTEIELIRALFGGVPILAVSDSSFHCTMPSQAREYAIPREVTEKFELYRFGFHGISLANIVSTLSKEVGGVPSRMVICHLGSGASITALKDGKSIDTSMGHSPLEGVVMSRRVGGIDVGAVLHLLLSNTVEDLETMFYTKSGLLALSELSDDMRVLLDADRDGHAGAHKAVEKFIYDIRKYIGAYSAILGGLDTLVFSGTIGERSFILRRRICEGLGSLHIAIDETKNVDAPSLMNIGTQESVLVYVIHSDEDKEIATRTLKSLL